MMRRIAATVHSQVLPMLRMTVVESIGGCCKLKHFIPTFLCMFTFLASLESVILTAAAEEKNPLENIGTVTAAAMLNCIDEGHGSTFCFTDVYETCEAHILGLPNNIYPCSTNTRIALKELVENRIRILFSESALLVDFQDTLQLGYQMCFRLDALASGMGQRRVGTHKEGCLNEVTIMSADEILSAIRIRE